VAQGLCVQAFPRVHLWPHVAVYNCRVCECKQYIEAGKALSPQLQRLRMRQDLCTRIFKDTPLYAEHFFFC